MKRPLNRGLFRPAEWIEFRLRRRWFRWPSVVAILAIEIALDYSGRCESCGKGTHDGAPRKLRVFDASRPAFRATDRLGECSIGILPFAQERLGFGSLRFVDNDADVRLGVQIVELPF